MPSSLHELGIEEKDIEALVNNVTRKGTRVIKHHSKDMDEEVVRTIYLSCL
jgi:alcohol dehydrogenase class IV